VASKPFQGTTLSGTSVAVTVGSTTVNALMYYTSDGQVAALLPSNTPTGTGMFTVTYNGQNSNTVNHGIASNNIGLFTIDSTGQGPGILTYPDYSLVSTVKASNCGGPNTTCGAANPGDTLTLWGTGLGPVTGDDASGAGLGQNMPNLALSMWVGGLPASVIYQGRSGCCVGEDQIVFTVPNNVPTGCAVPLVLEVNGQISNTAVMPIANGGRSCTPVNPALAPGNVEQAIAAGPFTFTSFTLGKNLNNNGTGYFDDLQYTSGTVSINQPALTPFFLSWIDDQPVGTCIVNNNLNGLGSTPQGILFGIADAGSSVTVKGPKGSQVVQISPGIGQTTIAADGSFFAAGSFTISGSGGADVGPFSAAITFPSFPTLVGPQNKATVVRSSGMTVSWTGGDPNGALQIVVTSATDQTFNLAVQAFCNVKAGPGTFTIPPYVLLALPTGPYAGFTIGPITAEVPFTSTGLSVGVLSTQIDGTGFALTLQ
jgi:uncharacterized protein (TIGR03437 family)